MEIYCPVCSHENPVTTTVCHSCGTIIEEIISPTKCITRKKMSFGGTDKRVLLLSC